MLALLRFLNRDWYGPGMLRYRSCVSGLYCPWKNTVIGRHLKENLKTKNTMQKCGKHRYYSRYVTTNIEQTTSGVNVPIPPYYVLRGEKMTPTQSSPKNGKQVFLFEKNSLFSFYIPLKLKMTLETESRTPKPLKWSNHISK